MNSTTTVVILTELLIKSVAVIAATSLLHRALHRLSAAMRHYLWIAAFAALILLPFTKFAQPLWSFAWEKASVETVVVPKPIPGLEAIETAPTAPLPPSPVQARESMHLPAWQTIAITTWMAGIVLILAYNVIGTIRLARINRRSVVASDPHLLAVLHSAKDEASIERSIALRISDDVRVPITWGTWRPVLLLPTDWIQWTDARLLAVLRHEIAHIARNDYLVRRLAQWVSAIYWPNPFVWLAGASLRQTQEQACDDRVLSQGTPPEDYATLLFESVRALTHCKTGADHALAMARPSTLESRIVAIVDDTRDRRPAGLSGMITAVPIVAVTLTASALAQVQNGTPRPIPGLEKPSGSVPARVVLPAKSPKDKAAAIIIPALEFKQTPLRDCLTFLHKKCQELDPAKEGVSFVLKFSGDDPAVKAPVTLSLRNVSLADTLTYITNLSNTQVRYEPNAISIERKTTGQLIQTEFKLPRKLFDPALPDPKNNAVSGFDRIDAKAFLIQKGIAFGEGSTAVYLNATERLVVRNTQENLDRIDSFIKAIPGGNVTPPAGQSKLETIIIPRLELRGAPIKQAIDFLSRKTQELDPEKKGIKVELAAPPEALEQKVTINLQNVPVGEALKYITSLGKLGLRTLPGNLAIVVPMDPSSLTTMGFRVPASSISSKAGTVTGPDGITYPSAQAFLSAFGVEFPAGAAAGIQVGTDTIVIRNTQDNIDIANVIITGLLDAKGGKLSDDQLKKMKSIISDRKAASAGNAGTVSR